MRPAQFLACFIACFFISPLPLSAKDELPPKAFKRKWSVSEIMDMVKKAGQEPVLLTGETGKRVVVVAPAMVGRVLCAAFDGSDGDVQVWLNKDQFEKGFTRATPNANWANFGGEERIWFGPEGGKYGTFFPHGKDQVFANYLVQEAMNTEHYKVTEKDKNGRWVTFNAPLQFSNWAGNKITLDVTRRIRVLDECPYTLGQDDRVEFTGFQSETFVKNAGKEPLSKERGAIAVWTLGIHYSTPDTVIMLPYHKGSDAELGKPLITEYFNTDAIDIKTVPEGQKYENYYSVNDDCVLIKGSGSVQTKLEMYPKRTPGRMASIDLKTMNMNIVEWPVHPGADYVAPYFLPQYKGDPYKGSALSVFVLPKWFGVPPFHELEAFSPALYLNPGDRYCHTARTWKLRGDKKAMADICKRYFNADLAELVEFNRSAP